MKEIPLSQGKNALVDDEDFQYLQNFKWSAYKNGNVFYTHRNYRICRGKFTKKSMHSEIMGKLQKGFEIDHIDGNGLNNQKSNLRVVTRRQNGQNRHVKKTSKFPGVSWWSEKKKWRATIQVNGKWSLIGVFQSEDAAFKAYQYNVESIGQTIVGLL
jgi:hypothetical protein